MIHKQIALFVAVCASINAFAESIPFSTAKRTAEIVMNTAATKGGRDGLFLVWDGSISGGTADASDKTPAPFYVFNREGGGFVIISGDDEVQPVLGYSEEQVFSAEDMPENISEWMEGYRKLVEDTRNRKIPVSPDAKRAWTSVLSESKVQTGIPQVDLHTALWDQGYPFNMFCPAKAGTATLTGCVATATAIVMKYYNYPEKGTGTLPGYTSGGITLPSINLDSGSGYAWSDMPESSYSSNQWTSQNCKTVARLMADCGTGVYAQYGTSGTSASSLDILPFLQRYMKYSRDARLVNKSSYKHNDWIALLKRELDCNRPVMYDGFDRDGGGHQFIIDGYDSNGFFKINWGWGGSDNGYFYISDMEYNNGNSAIVGLAPDPNWNPSSSSALLELYDNGRTAGIEASNPYIEQGKAFDINLCIINMGRDTFSGNVMLAHTSADGSIKEVLSVWKISSLQYMYYISMSNTATLGKEIEEGDEIRVGYEYENGWKAVNSGARTAIPLRYRLSSKVSLSYNKTRSEIKVTGLRGMTYSYGAASGSFASRDVVLTSEKGTKTLTVSNGHDVLSVDLTF